MVLFGEVAEFRSGSQHVFLRISPLDVPRASPGTFPNVGDNDPNLLLTEHSGSQRPCDPSEALYNLLERFTRPFSHTGFAPGVENAWPAK